MDQEQIERAIAFIVDQQAKFAAGMEDLRYRQETFQSEMEEMKSLFRNSTARLDRIEAIQQTQAGLITNVALQLKDVAVRVEKLAVKVDKLADLQQHTDGRLNIVISQVDELIRRWGEQQKPQ